MLGRLGRVLGDDGPMGRSLAVILLAAAWVSTWRPQIDPDAWWHLSIGDLVLSTGAIPHTEPFSWLTAGDRFVAHSWLWDVLLSASDQAGGATGTSLLILPVTALIVGLTWALIGVSAPDIPPFGRASLVLIAAVAALPLWAPRSQTLDVAFVLAATWVLARHLRSGGSRYLLSLPIIGLLWANLHGSAVLALAVVVAIAVVTAPIGTRWGTWPPRPRRPIVAAGAAGVLAACLNPYGPGLLAYPFDRSVASAFAPAIVEWQPPDFGSAELLVARVLLVAVVVVAVGWRGRSADPFLLLASACWAFAALGSVRFMAIASAVLVVALAPSVGPAITGWLGVESSRSGRGEVDAPTRRRIIGATAVVIVAMLVVGWSLVSPASQAAAIERRLPAAAVRALLAVECDVRLLPEYGWAGYVIRFADRQVGAYGDSAEGPVIEQAAVESLSIDPRAWLDDHQVTAVLMPAGGPLSRWLDEAEEWRPAYRDAQATIHVRAERSDCQITG